MKYYYYNAEENSFAVTTNFKLEVLPDGYVEITEEEYNNLVNSEE